MRRMEETLQLGKMEHNEEDPTPRTLKDRGGLTRDYRGGRETDIPRERRLSQILDSLPSFISKFGPFITKLHARQLLHIYGLSESWGYHTENRMDIWRILTPSRKRTYLVCPTA